MMKRHLLTKVKVRGYRNEVTMIEQDKHHKDVFVKGFVGTVNSSVPISPYRIVVPTDPDWNATRAKFYEV